MRKVSRKNQRQLHIWLDKDVRERLLNYTSKNGLIARTFIQDAIQSALDAEGVPKENNNANQS